MRGRAAGARRRRRPPTGCGPGRPGRAGRVRRAGGPQLRPAPRPSPPPRTPSCRRRRGLGWGWPWVGCFAGGWGGGTAGARGGRAGTKNNAVTRLAEMRAAALNKNRAFSSSSSVWSRNYTPVPAPCARGHTRTQTYTRPDRTRKQGPLAHKKRKGMGGAGQKNNETKTSAGRPPKARAQAGRVCVCRRPFSKGRGS